MILNSSRSIAAHSLTVLLLIFLVSTNAGSDTSDYFKITVVDEETGRGVPLVELKTTSSVRYYTDSNGIVAFSDPGLMDQLVYFHIKSHGYEFPEDSFGYRGKALKVTKGGSALLKINRINVAERLYRVTGQGIYHHSILVGYPVPIRHPVLNGKVTGQDTVIAIPYNGRIYWFWGDTNRPSYPLGNFAASGATSEWPGKGGLDPDLGVDLTYFVDESGFSKPMFPMDRPGLVWLEGLMLVRDPSGRERLVATYTRVDKAEPVEERGIAVFDDTAQIFRVLAQFPPTRSHHSSHPVRVTDDGRAYWYLYPNYRVPDDWNAIQDAQAYEAYACEKVADTVHCAWRPNATFLDTRKEGKLIEQGLLPPEAALFRFIDADTGRPVSFYIGSLAWNAYRKKWIMIGGAWGDVYYSEADAPQGLWLCAKRIVQHEKYNFYNVVHHPFFDKDGGRIIYFEGTYTTTSIKGARPTPLYDYNQITYKLSLDDARLQLPTSCADERR